MAEPVVKKVLPESIAATIDAVLDMEGNVNKNYPTLSSIGLFGLGLMRDTLLLGTSFFVSKKNNHVQDSTKQLLAKELECYLLHVRDKYKQKKDVILPNHSHDRYIDRLLKNIIGNMPRSDDVSDYEKTIERDKKIIEAGYNLVVKWGVEKNNE